MSVYPKKIITGLIIFGIVAIFFFILFHNQILKTVFGIAYDVALKPPERTFCVNTGDDYRCITDRAIQEKDASVCYYLDVGNSDRCEDEVIIGVKEASVCNKIRNQGTKRYCLEKHR